MTFVCRCAFSHSFIHSYIDLCKSYCYFEKQNFILSFSRFSTANRRHSKEKSWIIAILYFWNLTSDSYSISLSCKSYRTHVNVISRISFIFQCVFRFRMQFPWKWPTLTQQLSATQAGLVGRVFRMKQLNGYSANAVPMQGMRHWITKQKSNG